MKYLQITLVAIGLSIGSMSGATAATTNVSSSCNNPTAPCDIGALDTSSPLVINFSVELGKSVAAFTAKVPEGWGLKNIGFHYNSTAKTLSNVVGSIYSTGDWMNVGVSGDIHGILPLVSLGSWRFTVVANFYAGPPSDFSITGDFYKHSDDTVSAVPLPAGGLLLLTGLAGIGAARRKKKVA